MALAPILTVDDFLTVYGGEVIKAYNAEALVAKTVRTRTISSGKSATFPVYGREEAKLHTPGNDLFGASPDFAMDLTATDEIINIDKLLIAPQFVDDLNDAMAHYDVRGEMAMQAGASLSTAHERWCIAALGKAAVASSLATSTTVAIASLTGAQIATALQTTASAMDSAFIPRTGRYAVLPPAQFYKLMALDAVVSSDFGRGADRNGVGGIGTLWYMGFEILNSAVMDEFDGRTAAEMVSATGSAAGGPGPLYFGGTIQRNSLAFVGTLVYGICYHKDAIGTLQLKGITSEIDWIPERQGHLLSTKRAIGVDALRPGSAWTLVTTS